jgi:hypothetical protein
MAPGGCVFEPYGAVLVLVYYTVHDTHASIFFHASISINDDVMRNPHNPLFRLFRRLFTTRLSIHPWVHVPVLMHLSAFVGWEKKKFLEKK